MVASSQAMRSSCSVVISIGARLSIGDGAQRPPHLLLKFGAPEQIREIKFPAPPLQILADLPKGQIGQRGPSLAAGGLVRPFQEGDGIAFISNLEPAEWKGVNRTVAHIFSLPLDKSYYIGLYFPCFHRYNIRKFVNISPVIFGRHFS